MDATATTIDIALVGPLAILYDKNNIIIYEWNARCVLWCSIPFVIAMLGDMKCMNYWMIEWINDWMSEQLNQKNEKSHNPSYTFLLSLYISLCNQVDFISFYSFTIFISYCIQ